jgi:uncharacterized protein
MKWSRYNYLFRSTRRGWLLYNSAANAFVHIEDAVYPEILKIQSDPEAYDFGKDPALYFQLRNSGILVQDRDDDIQRNLLKLARLSNKYDTSHLLLTIAPTRACNFNCFYCYEQDREPVFMSDETADKVVEFTKRFKTAKDLCIIWYGGEPLLCFDRICSLTARIKELALPFEGLLVTNGFLLDVEKIEKLQDLKISTVQLTIDGPEATHNSRRPLRGGGPTFATIVRNLGQLLDGWSGKVNVRINIDEANRDQYHLIHDELIERYRKAYDGNRLWIYPGLVHDFPGANPDIGCLISPEKEAEFTIEQYRKYGIDDLRTFPRRSFGGCTACRRNGFVIGPEGEIYKCWDDLGVPERQIGSVQPGSMWNGAVLSDYMVAASYLDDPKCDECFFFPVCDGGCAQARLCNLLQGRNNDYCLKFKYHLEELLDIHFERKEKEPSPAVKAASSDPGGTESPGKRQP